MDIAAQKDVDAFHDLELKGKLPARPRTARALSKTYQG